MKMTEKIDAEIRQVMEEYWSSYLNGDLPTWASYLPDDYKNIGTTKVEIWNSKQEIVDFTKTVLDQTVGMAETRNKKTQIIPYDPYFMVHELGDLYVKAEEGWVFYAQFRLSSLLEKTAGGWKIRHQHGSYPDAKADEGEAFAFSELKIENKKLRDAIQARTIELERKNRELEIESALERVRAKTMAMHRSDELGATSLLLFDELKALGEISEQISIGIFDEENQVLNLYATLQGEQWKEATKVDLNEPHAMQKIHAGWQQQKKSLLIDLSGEELKAYNSFRSKYSNLKFPEERWVIHCAFFSKGVLTFSTTTPHDEQTMQLLERFAQVFDGTYTRFLDLQKAEAQAKEAQIEISLERIRGASMAMHKSEDLSKVTQVVFDQLKALNVDFINSWISIFDMENKKIDVWFSPLGLVSKEAFYAKVSYEGDGFLESAIMDWSKGYPFTRRSFRGKEFKEWIDYTSALTGYQFFSDHFNSENYSEGVEILDARSEYGNISAASNQPFNEEFKNIMARFAKVFDQTYRRFLDLQKAEAQTREAQIEAALEKVRSRSLAMHSTDELGEVITVVFERLKELQFSVDEGIALVTFTEGSQDMTEWMYNPDFAAPMRFRLPYFDHPVLSNLWEAKNNGDDFLARRYTAAENQSFLNHIFNHTDYKDTPEEVKTACLAAETYSSSIAIQNHTAIFINNYSGHTLSENEVDILKRFSRVFEQAYIRFLDLQKAEAQARGAQMEAALERVRARTMAMHHSEELKEVVAVLYQQIDSLQLGDWGCNIQIFNEEEGCIEIWLAEATQQIAPRRFLFQGIGHPDIQLQWDLWRDGASTYYLTLEGERKKSYDDYVLEHTDFKLFPPEVKAGIRSMEKACFSFAHMVHGFIVAISSQSLLSEENMAILQRFAKVFEQAYTRFLDLQKAEEQARKIKIVNEENERLLHSILPQPIAEQIRTGQPNVVKRFEHVSILFADIVGFTALSEKLPPGKVVEILNGLFSKFDDLTDKYGLEKIKTIGDAYMVAAGVPEENTDHAMTIFRFAQDMLRSLQEYNKLSESQLNLRIGISSGPVIAGVIGKKKFAYDLWGDSVNTAARMEAYGREGKIQVSPTSYELLKNDFNFEKIPAVHIKGKGVMDVYVWKHKN